MVEYSVAWCGSEAGTTWLQREVTGVKGAGRGGKRVSFTAKLLSSSCYQNKPPKTRQMMIRHLLHTTGYRRIREIYKILLPFPCTGHRTKKQCPPCTITSIPFCPSIFSLPCLFSSTFLFFPSFSCAFRKSSYIYSHSYVYSGRYSWIFYSLQLADFPAFLHAFLSSLRRFFSFL